MHPNGIVRRVDDLGRVVIPLNIRERLDIHEGTLVEIFTDKGAVVIRIYDPQCWYTEKWYDDDLETALEESGIPVTDENIRTLKAACKGAFDDKSERNSMLRQIASETFSKFLKED